MALIVEDGTGVIGANSYITVAELRAFATDRAITIPVEDSLCTPLLVKATDYLDLRDYIGTKAIDSQGLAWPRKAEGWYTEDNGIYIYTIPSVLKTAQAMVAIEVQNGELLPSIRPGKYTSAKVGSLSVSYATDANRSAAIRMTAVDTLLNPLLADGGFRILKTVRA